jgi:hypothetical protein
MVSKSKGKYGDSGFASMTGKKGSPASMGSRAVQ